MFTGSPELELVHVVVTIHLLSVSLTIALFYRPPGSHSLLTALCTHILFNYLNTSHSLFSKLLSVSNSLSLTQVVSVSTHYSSHLSSLIDLVFLSSPNHYCPLPPLSNSDHLGLSLAVSLAKPKRNPTRCKRKIRRYAFADFDLANEILSAIDWSALLSWNDVNSCWSSWRSKFLQVMETRITQAVLKVRRNLPWLNKAVVQAMRKRNLLFNTAK